MTASRRLTALAAALAVLALSGCTARTTVDLTVRSAQTADVVIAAEFTDEAAAVLSTDDKAMDELVTTFEQRTGAQADVTRSDDLVRVRAAVDYTALRGSATVTGVSQVRLSAEQDGQVQAAVDLTAAPDLLAAVSQATATQPDAGVVAATMAQSTQLVLTVRFPGGVRGEPSVVGVSSHAVSVDGDAVTVVRSAADARDGAIVVSGNPQGRTNWGLLVGGGSVVLVAVAALVARRRDQEDLALAP